MDAASYIRNQLQLEIVTGAVPEGTRFDEFEMTRRFAAPRRAVRSALTALADSGLVVRARRSGTVPHHLLLKYHVGPSMSFVPVMDEPMRMVTLTMERVRAPRDIIQGLELPEASDVTLIERSTLTRGEAVTRWWIWTTLDVLSRYPNGLPEHLTWYEVLRELTGEREFVVERNAGAYRATEADVNIIDVEIGSAINFVTRKTRLPGGRVLDRSFARMSPSRITAAETFTIRL